MVVQTQVLRPVAIKGWIALALMSLYTYIIFTKDHSLHWKDILVLMFGWLITAGLFMIGSSRIIIDNDGITHQQLKKKKFIAYNDIFFADLATHYHGHGYSVMWEVRTTDGKVHSFLPYGKINRHKMAEALAMKLSSSKLGERVIKLAEGKRVNFF